MNNPYKNRDWHLVVSIRWRLKSNVVATVKCEKCNGQGQYSGWGNLDEYADLSCKTCWGSGKVDNPELEPQPDVPEVFRNYIRGYFNKFFDDMDARRERNEKLRKGC